MILSASGWRKVFAESGDENDATTEIGNENRLLMALAAESFAEYILQINETPVVVCGCDARPTSAEISDAVIRVLLAKKIIVRYVGIAAAPEIMAFAKKFDGFVYVTASHNPIGHNGIKFGLNDGGVLEAREIKKIISAFEEKCSDSLSMEKAASLLAKANASDVSTVYAGVASVKQKSLAAYKSFVKETVTAGKDFEAQEKILGIIKDGISKRKLGVVCDFNGSARASCIDKEFFAENGISFYAINDTAGKIVHGIIPEGENLEVCAREMRRLQKEGHTEVKLGYMPDCDGDRGNIVYWDETKNDAVVMQAQEVFSLSVMAELAYSSWLNEFAGAAASESASASAESSDGAEASAGAGTGNASAEASAGAGAFRPAVCVNGPTSMRIERIAETFGAKVFRAEVGEANVVNLARERRAEGYNVRILGEGSNGGTITYPAAVRDPLNTIFAFIKLLVISDMFKSWCEKTSASYKEDFSLADIFATLPVYTTTPVSEKRAVIHLKTKDQVQLKKNFQNAFEKSWKAKNSPAKKFGFSRYEIALTNGTKETCGASDMSASGTGGLKILFYKDDATDKNSASGDSKKNPCAFMWMRGSQTEPLFRVMCDVSGDEKEMEKELLDWERELIEESDKK